MLWNSKPCKSYLSYLVTTEMRERERDFFGFSDVLSIACML